MYNIFRIVWKAEDEMFTALFAYLYMQASALSVRLLPVLTTAAPTGDINVMILVAVILIAAFVIFILLKGKRKDR